jgi:hypothetical protein
MKNPYYSYGSGGGDEVPLDTEHAEEIKNFKATLEKGKIYIKNKKLY